MPEAEVTKGYAKVDQEPPPDPAQVGQAAGGLVVVGEEEVVSEGDAEPDQVGAEQERVASGHLDPPPRRGHRRILGGVAGGLGLDKQNNSHGILMQQPIKRIGIASPFSNYLVNPAWGFKEGAIRPSSCEASRQQLARGGSLFLVILPCTHGNSTQQ